MGRLDNQIKLRGYRIELGEIEAVLRAHPAVDAAAVVLRGDDASSSYLEAVVILNAGSIALIENQAQLKAALVHDTRRFDGGTLATDTQRQARYQPTPRSHCAKYAVGMQQR